MSEKISRRKFFKFLGGVAIAPMVVAAVKPLKIIETVEFGWTWIRSNKNITDKTFSDIVQETLKANTQKIAENVGANNSLLVRIKERDEYIKINFISIEEQNERMKNKLNKRLNERKAKRYGIKEENVAISAWREPTKEETLELQGMQPIWYDKINMKI